MANVSGNVSISGLNSPRAVVVVQQAANGLWYAQGSAVPIAGNVSVANIANPTAITSMSQDSAGNWTVPNGINSVTGI